MTENEPRFNRDPSKLDRIAHYMRRMQDQVENSYVLERSQRRLGRLAAGSKEEITKPTGVQAET